MKNLLIAAITFCALFASCNKDSIGSPGNNEQCQGDGLADLKIYNGINVDLDITVRPNNGGPWSTNNGTLLLKRIKTGERWSLQLVPGSYIVDAKGEEPGPFAHNSYNFNDVKALDDCAPTEISY